MNLSRRSLALGAVVLASALGAMACNSASADQSLPPAAGSGAAAPPVLAPPAAPSAPEAGEGRERGAWSAIGTARAIESAELASDSGGVLRQIYVEEGDRVKKGQILFRIDSRSQALDVKRARVAVESAEVTLRAAEKELERSEKLSASGAVARATLDQAVDRHASAELALEQARVAVSTARRSAGETVVRSPISGVVSAKHKSAGESVGRHGETVVAVHDISKLEVRARVPESALATLRAGAPVDVTFEALSVTRSAKIERLSPTVDERTRTVEVVAIVDNGDESLKAGMLVRMALPKAPAAAASAAGSAR